MKELLPLSESLISTRLNSMSSNDLRKLEELLSARMELLSSCDYKDLQGRVELVSTINGITRKIMNHLDSVEL